MSFFKGNRKEVCKNCIFWERLSPESHGAHMFPICEEVDKNCHEEDYDGHCRRYPPEVHCIRTNFYDEDEGIFPGELPEPRGFWRMFPVTEKDDWCGEFKQKNKEDYQA